MGNHNCSIMIAGWVGFIHLFFFFYLHWAAHLCSPQPVLCRSWNMSIMLDGAWLKSLSEFKQQSFKADNTDPIVWAECVLLVARAKTRLSETRFWPSHVSPSQLTLKFYDLCCRCGHIKCTNWQHLLAVLDDNDYVGIQWRFWSQFITHMGQAQDRLASFR